jgi:hypothetical protein
MIASMLFGLAADDARVYATAVAFLSCVGMVASFQPVLRAVRIHTMVALRCD